MAQHRALEPGNPVTVQLLRRLLQVFPLHGVWTGFQITLLSPWRLQLDPGFLLLPSGSPVEETTAREVQVEQQTGTVSLGVFALRPEGSEAFYRVLDLTTAAQQLQGDWLQIATLAATSSGVTAGSIVMEQPLRPAFQDLINGSLMVALSDGWLARDLNQDVGPLTLVQESGKFHAENVSSTFSLEAHIPFGLRPTQVQVTARQTAGAAGPGSLSITFADHLGSAFSSTSPSGASLTDAVFVPIVFDLPTEAFLPGLGSFSMTLDVLEIDIRSVIVVFSPTQENLSASPIRSCI